MSVQKLLISLKLNLRKLILILLLVSLVILFSITLIVSNVIHRQQLINNSLATNYEYAAKVASISDLYFKNIFNDLSLSANIIKNDFHNEQLLKTELNRLIQQSNSFSSVLISDADGHVIEYAPEILKLDKVAIIRSLGFSKSLESKKPYISSPYYSWL
ncbi:PDC sensor domain-containing protein [Acinetobacter variabilis]|uniref:PDC sensor domain-containing protein n=1 Tax=Acinetobacter variabilis TaxID=70346 RepID=A0A7T8AQ68_9GAMM|nr:PDC sensor domain-containing protein [Acinetobacter variabilis]QQN88811.1 PDC sensor domain-containing protein [Acinetobacter variabilis]